MIEDLLQVMDLEPPMGDLCSGNRLDRIRSVWLKRQPGEVDTPKTRIIHQREVRLHGPARLERLGLRPAQGYHKCGSRLDLDWVVDLRVSARVAGQWQEILSKTGLARPGKAEALSWFGLHGIVTDAVVIEVRRCGIDGGWTPWNLVQGAFVLEGERLTPLAPRLERRLQTGACDLAGLPRGVTAAVVDGTVRYSAADFAVGFRLDRPGFSFLGFGTESAAQVGTNLLKVDRVSCEQGLRWQAVGAAPRVAPTVRCDLAGTVTVRGGEVAYDVTTGGQRFQLTWQVSADGLVLKASRTSRRREMAWQSAAWAVGWRNSVAPIHAVGTLTQTGQTGGLMLPTWIDAPGFGAWLIESTDAAAGLRSECRRSEDLNVIELKVGERVGLMGLAELPAGRHEAEFRLRPMRAPETLRRGAPAVARAAMARTALVAPTFRPDIGALSNSGASMPCPISFDTWTSVLPRLGLETVAAGAPSGWELVRVTLERWLQEGPGYAAGMLSHAGQMHHAEDEYLMTGAVGLRAAGDYLMGPADERWYRTHRDVIVAKIRAARARDLDGDGLIESPYRTGVSGTGQWSTCWMDVINCGWKCAWSNAALYGALRQLACGYRRFGAETEAVELDTWAEQLRAAFGPTFRNPITGWLGAWRSRDGKLHDHAFLPINGIAVHEGLVTRAEGKVMLRKLLDEAARVGLPDPALGLPLSLWPVPDEDCADIMQGYPFGYYQNGGRTHSQSRHFVKGLYAAGLRREADAMLLRLCEGLAEARVFGGNQSGRDWRTWADEPCGYEGLLTDQFGVLDLILDRWGRAEQRAVS